MKTRLYVLSMLVMSRGIMMIPTRSIVAKSHSKRGLGPCFFYFSSVFQKKNVLTIIRKK